MSWSPAGPRGKSSLGLIWRENRILTYPAANPHELFAERPTRGGTLVLAHSSGHVRYNTRIQNAPLTVHYGHRGPWDEAWQTGPTNMDSGRGDDIAGRERRGGANPVHSRRRTRPANRSKRSQSIRDARNGAYVPFSQRRFTRLTDQALLRDQGCHGGHGDRQRWQASDRRPTPSGGGSSGSTHER